MKQKQTNKHSVLLYDRTLSSGKVQFYLKISGFGKRIQESTGILIDPCDSKSVRKEKMLLAEKYREKREQELDMFVLGISSDDPKERIDHSFYDYFEYCARKDKSKATTSVWMLSLDKLKEFRRGEELTFRMINKKLVEDFRNYLLFSAIQSRKNQYSSSSCNVKISTGTASLYFSKFKACLRQAFIDGIIQTDISVSTRPINNNASRKKEFLTEEDILKLIDTPIRNDVVKRAFLFSMNTGLRFSDIRSLLWSNIIVTNGEVRIVKQMTKIRKKNIDMALNDYSIGIIGKIPSDTRILNYSFPAGIDPSDTKMLKTVPREYFVFPGMINLSTVNECLQAWVNRAGINKHISFHCLRGTFATIVLTKGADIYTVSELLCHSNIKTTQIYAKVVDERKNMALNSLNDVFKCQK